MWSSRKEDGTYKSSGLLIIIATASVVLLLLISTLKLCFPDDFANPLAELLTVIFSVTVGSVVSFIVSDRSHNRWLSKYGMIAKEQLCCVYTEIVMLCQRLQDAIDQLGDPAQRVDKKALSAKLEGMFYTALSLKLGIKNGISNWKYIFDTIETISSLIQPRLPSEDFANKVSEAAQERFKRQISVDKIKKVIAVAATDKQFREALFHDVAVACRGIGIEVAPEEVAALRALEEDVIEEFGNSLDERLTKFLPASFLR